MPLLFRVPGRLIRPLITLVLAFALIAGTQPPLAAAARPPKLDYRILTLPNGLRVVLSEDHSTPIVHAEVWYHVGSKNE